MKAIDFTRWTLIFTLCFLITACDPMRPLEPESFGDEAAKAAGAGGDPIAVNDTPTASAVGPESLVALSQGGGKGPPARVKTLHFAQVKADGTLMNGTALSATWMHTGNYLLTFPAGIGGCAAAVNHAVFPGWDATMLRGDALLRIGFDENGVFDDETVRVIFWRTPTGDLANTAFTLVMLCP